MSQSQPLPKIYQFSSDGNGVIGLSPLPAIATTEAMGRSINTNDESVRVLLSKTPG
jgi:hypothetical protein